MTGLAIVIGTHCRGTSNSFSVVSVHYVYVDRLTYVRGGQAVPVFSANPPSLAICNGGSGRNAGGDLGRVTITL